MEFIVDQIIISNSNVKCEVKWDDTSHKIWIRRNYDSEGLFTDFGIEANSKTEAISVAREYIILNPYLFKK